MRYDLALTVMYALIACCTSLHLYNSTALCHIFILAISVVDGVNRVNLVVVSAGRFIHERPHCTHSDVVFLVSLSSDKRTYCKSLWIKAPAQCLEPLRPCEYTHNNNSMEM